MFITYEISISCEILGESEMTPADVQPTRVDLLHQVVDILEEITSSGPHAISQEWFTLHLRIPHLRVLFLLLREGTLRMSDLASTLDVSVSGATGLVDRLVDQELVDRSPDPDDRRSVLCFPTEKGRGLGYRLLTERRTRWEERLAPLTEAELKKVCKAMELIRSAALREVRATESMSANALGR